MRARTRMIMPRSGAGTPAWPSRLSLVGFLIKGLAWLALGIWALY